MKKSNLKIYRQLCWWVHIIRAESVQRAPSCFAADVLITPGASAWRHLCAVWQILGLLFYAALKLFIWQLRHKAHIRLSTTSLYPKQFSSLMWSLLISFHTMFLIYNVATSSTVLLLSPSLCSWIDYAWLGSSETHYLFIHRLHTQSHKSQVWDWLLTAVEAACGCIITTKRLNRRWTFDQSYWGDVICYYDQLGDNSCCYTDIDP